MSTAASVNTPASPSTSALLARQPSTVAPSVGVSPLGYSPFGSSCRLSVESFQRQNDTSDDVTTSTESGNSPPSRRSRCETAERRHSQGNGSDTRGSLTWSQETAYAVCNDRLPRHVSFALEDEFRDLGSLDGNTPSNDSSFDGSFACLNGDLQQSEPPPGVFQVGQRPSTNAAIGSYLVAATSALMRQYDGDVTETRTCRQARIETGAGSPSRQNRLVHERTGPYEGLELVIPERKTAPPPAPPPAPPVQTPPHAPQSSNPSSKAFSDKIEFVTPWNLSRWIILLSCLVITVTTGSFFFNWPTTQMMILKSNAYSWLCHEGDEELFSDDGTGMGLLPPNSNPPLTITPSNSEAAYLHLPNGIGQDPNDPVTSHHHLSHYPIGTDILGITTSAGAFPVMRRVHAVDVSSWPVLAAHTGLARRLLDTSSIPANPLVATTAESKLAVTGTDVDSTTMFSLRPTGETPNAEVLAKHQKESPFQFVRKADLVPPLSSDITPAAGGADAWDWRTYRRQLSVFRRRGLGNLEDVGSPLFKETRSVFGQTRGGWTPTSEDPIKRQLSASTQPRSCIKQIQRINSLMPVGVASWFFFSFIGGVMMDVLGPKLTSCTGLILSSTGWITLAFCSQNVQLYFLAFALIGCGVDVVFLGILNTANLFPNYRGTIVSIFNAARSLAFAIPAVVNSLLNVMPFTVACILYAATLLAWIFVVCVLVPNQPYPNIQTIPSKPDLEEEVMREFTRRTGLEQEPVFSGMGIDLAEAIEPPERETCSMCERCSQKLGVGPTALESMTTVSSAQQQQIGCLLSPVRLGGDSMQSLEHQLLDDIALKDPGSSPIMHSPFVGSPALCPDCAARETGSLLIQREGTATLYHAYTPPRWIARGIDRAQRVIIHAKSLTFFPLIPMAMLTVLRGSFLSNSAMDQLGPFVHLFSILTPLSFLPAPLFGFVADKVSIHAVFAILNTLGSLQFLLLVIAPHASFSMASVAVLNLLVSAFFLGQFYCYVTLSFPSEVGGTLVGITISSAGLFGLLVTPMYNYSTNANSFRLMNWMCLNMTLVTYVCIWSLWKASAKREKAK